MVRTYKVEEKSTSLNTFSHLQAKKINNPEKIVKAREDFAAQSKKWDYYKDDMGAVWVVSWLGKSQEDSEWRIWTTYKTPMTANDANYIVEKLNKSQALEVFDSLVGLTHDEIMSAFTKALKLPKMIKSKVEIDPMKTNRQKIRQSYGEYTTATIKRQDGESIVPTIVESTIKDENYDFEKSKPRIGKPYEQQPGRERGQGKGKIGIKSLYRVDIDGNYVDISAHNPKEAKEILIKEAKEKGDEGIVSGVKKIQDI